MPIEYRLYEERVGNVEIIQEHREGICRLGIIFDWEYKNYITSKIPEEIEFYPAIVIALDTERKGDQVVGFGAMTEGFGSFHLSAAMVEKSYRHRGICSGMEKQLIEAAKRSGIRELTVATRDEHLKKSFTRKGYEFVSADRGTSVYRIDLNKPF